MDWVGKIQEAISYIENNLFEPINAEEVGKAINYSPNSFSNFFSAIVGYSVGEYIRLRRLSVAAERLTTENVSVTDMAFECGYESVEAFSRAFKRAFNFSPSQKYPFQKFSPITIDFSIKGGFNMERKLISNVPVLALYTTDDRGFIRSHYLTSFIGTLYVTLKSVGENYSYAELLAYSGYGNCLAWTLGKWQIGNGLIENFSEQPLADMQKRLINSIGWEMKKVVIERDKDGTPLNITDEQIRQDFVASIDRGIPVIARGITDSDFKMEYTVFFGYQDNGKKIVGWDYFQNNNNNFTREDWEKELKEYIILTNKITPQTELERVIEMFRLITDYYKKTEIRGVKVGLAAWKAFLEDLQSPDYLTCRFMLDGEGYASSRQIYTSGIKYCDAPAQLFERITLSAFYKELASKYPEWEKELMTAAKNWAKCGQYGANVQSVGLSKGDFERLTGGRKKNNSWAGRTWRSPKYRASLWCKAMKCEAKAIEQIEKILIKEKQHCGN